MSSESVKVNLQNLPIHPHWLFFSIFRTTSFLSEQPESWSVEILHWNISLMPFADRNRPITMISPSLIYQALTTNGGEILGSELDFRIYTCPSTSGQVHFWTPPLRSGMLSCKERKPHLKVFTSNLSELSTACFAGKATSNFSVSPT